MPQDVLEKMEERYAFLTFPQIKKDWPEALQYPLYVHLINALGYREDWAAPLLEYVRFNAKGQPYFEISPQTPEAHRHKFLITLTLSQNNPGHWKIKNQNIEARDFVLPILEGPLEDWVDRTVFPEMSWTLQYLSRFHDEQGYYQSNPSPLAKATGHYLREYLEDFSAGRIYHRGQTSFCESGFHVLECLNKLSKKQGQMVIEQATAMTLEGFFPLFKKHFLLRFNQSLAQIGEILALSQEGMSETLFDRALSELLALGHMMETYLHPEGKLVEVMETGEKETLPGQLKILSQLMTLFLNESNGEFMSPKHKDAFPFPLLHAHHALNLAKKLDFSLA